MPDRTMSRAAWAAWWRSARLARNAGAPDPLGYPLLSDLGDLRSDAAFWLKRAGDWRRNGNLAVARRRVAWAREERQATGALA